jgi:hypothetical protein
MLGVERRESATSVWPLALASQCHVTVGKPQEVRQDSSHSSERELSGRHGGRISLVGGACSPSCASRCAMPSSLVHAQHARASPSPLCPYCCQGLCAQAPPVGHGNIPIIRYHGRLPLSKAPPICGCCAPWAATAPRAHARAWRAGGAAAAHLPAAAAAAAAAAATAAAAAGAAAAVAGECERGTRHSARQWKHHRR